MGENEGSNGPAYKAIDPKISRLVLIGVALSVFAACFDTTVLDALQNKISISFGYAYDIVPTLLISFMLTEAIMIAISGKLSDIYGRKPILLIGSGLFVTGSVLVALSTEQWLAVVGRTIEGAGSGAIIPMAIATVGDLYPPEKRGKIQGIMCAVLALGMAAGPVVGGILARLGPEGWRLAFVVNVPTVLISIALTYLKSPLTNKGIEGSIDYKGLAILSILLLDVVLFLTLYGSVPNYVIAVMGIVAIPLFIGFVKIENGTNDPIISMGMFKNHVVRQGAIIYFLMGFCLIAIQLFTNLYAQRIMGMEVDEAGLYILIQVIGILSASMISAPFIDRTGCKPWVVGGSILFTLGLLMFSMISTTGITSAKPYFAMSQALCGLGMGAMGVSTTTMVMNGCDPKEMGMVTSTVYLLRNIGAIVGTTVLTLVSSAYIYNFAGDYFENQEFADAIRGDGFDILAFLNESVLAEHFPDIPLEEVSDGIRSLFVNSANIAFALTVLCGIVTIITALVPFRHKLKMREKKRKS